VEESEDKKEMEESEINKRVKMLMEKFMAERGCYVHAQFKICGKQLGFTGCLWTIDLTLLPQP